MFYFLSLIPHLSSAYLTKFIPGLITDYVNELRLIASESQRQRHEEYKKLLEKQFEFGRPTPWNTHSKFGILNFN